MAGDKQKRFAEIAESLKGETGVSPGADGKKKFGSTALKVDNRIFAMLTSKDEFVVKLPAARVAELEDAGVGRRFDPGHGRLMKQWLTVDGAASKRWQTLAAEALAFVRAGG